MATIAEIGLYNYLVMKNTPELKDKISHFTLKKGAQLYGTPQRFTNVYEIISGAAKLGRLSPEGKECVYEIVSPGEFFGNLAILNDAPFCEFSKTLTATEVRSYDLQFFKHLMTHDPEVAEWFYTKIVSRWNKTESLLYYIRSFEPRKRITMLQTNMHRKIMTALRREVFLDKLISNKDMADLTATTRQLVADTFKSSLALHAE
jgi:CRP/FNR family cyclic AMP-dependent transcriptional regulator